MLGNQKNTSKNGNRIAKRRTKTFKNVKMRILKLTLITETDTLDAKT